MKKRSAWWVYLCLFALSVIFLSCEDSSPIKIGYVSGLTGLLSDLGINGRDGILLAVEEVNRTGGIHNRPIELIIKDDEHNPEIARKVVQELIDEEVVAIIGHMNSAMSISSIPIINKAKLLMLSPSTSTNTLTGIDDYFIRISPPSESMMDVLPRFIINEIGIKKIACVYDLSNLGYTGEMYEKFRDEFTRAGGELTITETFSAGSEDSYLEITQRMIDSGPEGLFVLAGSFDTAMFCQQLNKLGSRVPVFTSGWAGTSDLIKYGGPAVEGIILVEQFDKENKNPDYLTFREKFLNTYNREPGFSATNSYEAAQVLFEAIRRDKSLAELKSTILEIGSFPGLQGDIIIDEYGDTELKCFLGTVEGGKFRTIIEYNKDY